MKAGKSDEEVKDKAGEMKEKGETTLNVARYWQHYTLTKI